MSDRFHRRGMGRRLAACLAIAACSLAGTASAAAAEVTFGGDPSGTVSPEATCGMVSCTLYWTGPGGNDLAPIPSGGSGTITSVTLPAMQAPGTMQAVVLSSSQASREPARTEESCCAAKELSAPFTVTANAVTTVPLALSVSAGDGVGISLLTPNASTPLHATENPADALPYWAPTFSAPTTTVEGPTGETVGYELAARFTFVEASRSKTPAPGAPGTPGAPTPSRSARSGVKLSGASLRLGRDGRTLTLGKATNPPTASTRQTLTVPGRAKKPIVLGFGKTKVPSGRSAPLKLTLNARGRAAQAEGRVLKARLTVVATNAEGDSQTLVRGVTIRRAED